MEKQKKLADKEQGVELGTEGPIPTATAGAETNSSHKKVKPKRVVAGKYIIRRSKCKEGKEWQGSK